MVISKPLYSVVICRFFGGFFGSAPLAISGGQLADIWDPVTRGIALCVFAGATMIGPLVGRITGGFVTMSYLGWRWTQYLTAILAFTFATVTLLVVPETLEPVLLSQKAKKIRHGTQNWAIHAKSDEVEVNVSNLLNKYLIRPYAMLFLEPILLLITIYMSVVYAIIYMLFVAWPISFQEERGWNLGVGSLPYVSIIGGVVLGSCIIAYFTMTRYRSKLETTGKVDPEERLVPMMIGGVLFSASMFWFAWTSDPDISWVPQVLSGIPLGAGILMIMMQGLNYLIDVYLMYANSAIAANTFMRSLLAAGFPLFADAM